MVTLVLMVLIWVTISRFKRVEVQVIQDDQETSYGIFKKLYFLKMYQILFISVVMCFQIPLSLALYKGYYQAITNTNFEPQPWSFATIILTIASDIFILILATAFLATTCLQILSFLRLINFLTQRCLLRILFYTCLLLLSVLYLHDTLLMLSYNWGVPAWTMTQTSLDENDHFVNAYSRCIVNFTDATRTRSLFFKWGELVADSLKIQQCSRLVWTFTLYGGMIFL